MFEVHDSVRYFGPRKRGDIGDEVVDGTRKLCNCVTKAASSQLMVRFSYAECAEQDS
jgi:hypothetical protein